MDNWNKNDEMWNRIWRIISLYIKMKNGIF